MSALIADENGDGLSTVAKSVRKPPKKLTKFPWETLLAENDALKEAISVLPKNYEFEIPKCLHKIITLQAKTVALQFPEGLLFCACIISDIITNFTGARVIILSDVTYGACCVDDYTAEKLGADLLIHYGHSCLVPIQSTSVKSLYVFVEIYFTTDHLLSMIQSSFPSPQTKIALLGTVQFLRAVREVSDKLKVLANDTNETMRSVIIPQVKPLSPGETLGCTSPLLPEDTNVVIFIADGRFHMESMMIRNAQLPHLQGFYRYDPYSKKMTKEDYDTKLMKSIRWKAIEDARQPTCQVFGVILGTLGHQGNAAILARMMTLLAKHGKQVIPILMSELNPQKLAIMENIDGWIQIACPRLSIDWGAAEYSKPILTPYEAYVAFGEQVWEEIYPMDYYSNEKKPWSNYA